MSPNSFYNKYRKLDKFSGKQDDDILSLAKKVNLVSTEPEVNLCSDYILEQSPNKSSWNLLYKGKVYKNFTYLEDAREYCKSRKIKYVEFGGKSE